MSKFGDKFMYQHSMKAPDEMRQLHDKFYNYISDNKIATKSNKVFINEVEKNIKSDVKNVDTIKRKEENTLIHKKKDKRDNTQQEDLSER